MRGTLAYLALVAARSAAWGEELYLPDPKHTPGAINPEVTQENIQETACLAGWIEKIAPPASYTNRLKAKQIKALRLKGAPKD